jgi:hypothetical protein
MARSTSSLLGVGVALFVLAGAAEAQTRNADPVIGTWQLNVERSVWSPGPRPPADLISLYDFTPMEDGWTRFTLTSVNAQGVPTIQLSPFRIDGEARPVHNQNTLAARMVSGEPTNLTRSYRRIDSHTTEFTTFNNGVAGIPQVRTVSPDGQTYTMVTRGTNAQGVAVSNVLVFDRVR